MDIQARDIVIARRVVDKWKRYAKPAINSLKAKRFFRTKLLQKALFGFSKYRENRLAKYQSKEDADKWHSRHQLMSSLALLKQFSWNRRRRLVRYSIGCKYWEKRCLNGSMVIWKDFHQNKRSVATSGSIEYESRINEFIAKIRQRRGMKCLIRHRISSKRFKLVKRIRDKYLLSCFWSTWSQAHADVHAREQIALAHYTRCLLRRSFSHFQKRSHQFMGKRLSMQEAEWFYKQTRCRRAIVKMQNCKKRPVVRDVSFLTERLLKLRLLQWAEFTLTSRMQRAANSLGIRHWAKRRVSLSFHWLVSSLSTERNNKLALTFRRASLLLNMFRKWRILLSHLKTGALRHSIARRCNSTSLLRHSLKTWRVFKDRKLTPWRASRGVGLDGALFYRKKLAGKILQALAVYAMHRKECDSRRRVGVRHFYCNSRRRGLQHWAMAVAEGKRNRQVKTEVDAKVNRYLLAVAVRRWHRKVTSGVKQRRDIQKTQLRSALSRWVRRTKLSLRLRQTQRDKAQQVVMYMQRYRSSICFKYWKNMQAHVKHQTMLITQVDKIYAHNMRRAYFKQWRGWYLSQLQLRLKLSAARQCWESRLVSKVFRSWRRYWRWGKHSRHKLMLALHCWKFHLQSRIFGGWVKYTKHKKLKREEAQEALDIHRSILVRSSVCAWLDRAGASLSRKVGLASDRREAQLRRELGLAAKYARRWRAVVVERRRKSAGVVRSTFNQRIAPIALFKPPPQRTVTEAHIHIPSSSSSLSSSSTMCLPPRKRTQPRGLPSQSATSPQNIPKITSQPVQPFVHSSLQTPPQTLPTTTSHPRSQPEQSSCSFTVFQPTPPPPVPPLSTYKESSDDISNIEKELEGLMMEKSYWRRRKKEEGGERVLQQYAEWKSSTTPRILQLSHRLAELQETS